MRVKWARKWGASEVWLTRSIGRLPTAQVRNPLRWTTVRHFRSGRAERLTAPWFAKSAGVPCFGLSKPLQASLLSTREKLWRTWLVSLIEQRLMLWNRPNDLNDSELDASFPLTFDTLSRCCGFSNPIIHCRDFRVRACVGFKSVGRFGGDNGSA